MTLLERNKYLQEIYFDIEGINMRRAYISVMYITARDKFAKTGDVEDRQQMDSYKNELKSIAEIVLSRAEWLRTNQDRYLVEYDGEVTDAEGKTFFKRHKVELFLLNDCDIDTFANGWDLEKGEGQQEILYEVADFLLQYRMTNFFVLNIKKISTPH